MSERMSDDTGTVALRGRRIEGESALRELHTKLPDIVHLELVLEAVAPTLVSAWVGSSLHGAFGAALREIACSATCDAQHASEPQRCAFARLFNSALAPRGPGGPTHAVPSLGLRPASPAPPRVLAPGDHWPFRLTLFGSAAIQDARVALAAIDRMAESGLGRGRGRLRLASARASGIELWADGRAVADPPALPPSTWAPWRPAAALRVRGVTPLHLTRKSKPRSWPRLRNLVKPALGRLMALAEAHGRGRPALELEETAEALTATLDGRDLVGWEPFETSRWSERQRQHHEVAGLCGELWAPSVAAPVATLLTWASEVGIGKSTAMGLGQIDVELLAPMEAERREPHAPATRESSKLADAQDSGGG